MRNASRSLVQTEGSSKTIRSTVTQKLADLGKFEIKSDGTWTKIRIGHGNLLMFKGHLSDISTEWRLSPVPGLGVVLAVLIQYVNIESSLVTEIYFVHQVPRYDPLDNLETIVFRSAVLDKIQNMIPLKKKPRNKRKTSSETCSTKSRLKTEK